MIRLLAALVLLLCGASCATMDPSQEINAGQRAIVPLTDGWGFAFADDWTEVDAAAAPVDAWEPVAVPHSWNRLGEYRVGRTAATDNRQGKGWYRRVIDGRSLDHARRHFIEFGAVGNIADVWLNGRHVAHHAGAFTRFRGELTNALRFDGENVLLVRADNSDPQPGSTTQHTIPLLGDFFIHGGIYRPAFLVSVAPSHIALDDFGGPGLYATPVLQPDGDAEVRVLLRLSSARAGQSVAVYIADATGRTVASTRIAVGEAQREVHTSLSLARPRLWNGPTDPYRYRIHAALEDKSLAIDSVDQPLGIRSIRVDPDRGFFLNGKHLQVRGVSRHQDYLGQGWVLSEADHRRDMALIVEMGANGIRVAHYPQDGLWFDLADEHGMMLWAEVPFVNKVAFTDAEATPELTVNARMQMTEMIRQYFNHPSIVTWGIGNEVDIYLAFNRLGPRADARPLLRELNALSHREDPSRPTVIADCCEATPGEKAPYLPVLTREADLMGYNRYYGWYYGAVDDLGPHLDMLHARHPTVPLSVSEYGAGGALTQHSDHSEGRPTNITGRPQPEEFQSWWHEQSWPQIRARPYLWGSWIWNMFDFSSRIRQEGDATDINTKGLVSFDRATKKDAFYYYKAQWSDAPMLHITSRRHLRRTDPLTRVKVYANVPEVAVSLNGRALGTVRCVDRVCTLEGVRLTSGLNRLVVSATSADIELRDEVVWELAPN